MTFFNCRAFHCPLPGSLSESPENSVDKVAVNGPFHQCLAMEMDQSDSNLKLLQLRKSIDKCAECGAFVCVRGWTRLRYLQTAFQSALLLLHSFVEQHSSGRQRGQRSGSKEEAGCAQFRSTSHDSVCVCISAWVFLWSAGRCILIANNCHDKARAYRVPSFVLKVSVRLNSLSI